MYVLRHDFPSFEVVDGPLVGQAFQHGQKYEIIPEEMADRFEATPAPAAKQAAEETEESRPDTIDEVADEQSESE